MACILYSAVYFSCTKQFEKVFRFCNFFISSSSEEISSPVVGMAESGLRKALSLTVSPKLTAVISSRHFALSWNDSVLS